LSDVAGVVAVQKGKLDENYLKQWADRLDVTENLAKALSGELHPKHT